MNRTTVLEVGADGVAIIGIQNPPLNLLSVDVMITLKRSIEEALERDDVKAIVLTGSKGKFSSGFNVTAFGGSQAKKTKRELGFFSIEFVTDTLEAAKKPLVAAIEGLALGGGLEIALACHARISTSTAQLGLPELQYGILPGLGGTQRLPRLIGLSPSLEMILMSKRINGVEAQKLGLVDAIVPANKLLKTAQEWALDISEYKRPWTISLYRTSKLEPFAEARVILKSARAQIRKQTPNLVHPLVCIDVIEQGVVSGARDALWKEAEALDELRQSSTCKSLVHIFFARYKTSKIPGITDVGLLPRNIKKVAVIGGGFMGSEIATMLILCNYNVILKVVDELSLLDSIGRVKANLQKHVETRKVNEAKIEKALALIEGVITYDTLKDVDLVIEAAPPGVSSKHQTFAEIERYCPQHCIFSFNTSAINLNLTGDRSKLHDRIVGAHFFSPSPVMPLLEIVRTDKTSPQVLVDLIDFGRKIKKTPVVFGNSKGFVVNRMFLRYLQSASFLVEHGADVYWIDQSLKRFGMSLGPFRMVDLVGFQSVLVIGLSLPDILPERSFQSTLIRVMQEDYCGGECNGRGFYIYDDNCQGRTDPDIMMYIEKAWTISNVRRLRTDPELAKLHEADIVEMVLFPVLNEAFRIIAEGIPIKASDLDFASVAALGFPTYRGGICFWSQSLGLHYIVSKLGRWSKKYGNIFQPCTYLMELAFKETPLGEGNDRLRANL